MMAVVVTSAGTISDALALGRSGSLTQTVTLPSVVGDPKWNIVFKTADESTDADTTLSDDSELTWTIGTGVRHAVRGFISFETDSTADFKWALDASATPTEFRLHHYAIPGGGTSVSVAGNVTTEGTSIDVAGTDVTGSVFFQAVIHNNTGADITLTIQWAQRLVSVTDTTVKAGSYIEYKPVA